MPLGDVLPPVYLDREEGLRRRLALRNETPTAGHNPFDRLKSTGHALLSQGAVAFGADEFAEEQLTESNRAAERAAANRPRVHNVEDIRSATDALDWAGGVVQEQIPNLAVTIGSATLGRFLGGRLGGAAGANVGTAAGAVGASTGLESGEIFRTIASDPEARKTHSLDELSGVAATSGLAAGSLDALPVLAVFNKFGVGKAAKEAIRRGLARRVATGVATGAALEGSTEGVQTVIERSAHKFVNDHIEVFGEEGIREILNSMAAGGLLGFGFGGVGGLAAPRSRIEDRMAELEADDELGTARGNAQREALRDIPELEGQLDAFDVSRPEARAELDGLAANYDRVIGARRDPLAVIRSHVKQEHLQDLDAPALDAISKLATGDLELTPEIRQLLEPRFHYFNQMIDQVRSLYGLKPESVEIEGTQSGVDVAHEGSAAEAELTKPARGEDGEVMRDEQGNLVRPAEAQGTRSARYRFQGGLDGVASLETTNAIHGGSYTDTSTRRELLRLQDDDPDTDYDLVPLGEALRDELARKGVSKAEAHAELGRRGQARFDAVLAKLKDPGKQARLQALFDPANPAAFLKHFEVIRERGLPEAVKQGDEDVLTLEDTKGDKVAGRKAIFGERGRSGELYDGQFLVQDGEIQRAVVAPRLVRRMLQKQGVKDLDNPTLSQIKSAWAGGIHALSKRGMKVLKKLPDNSTVAYSGGRRVVYGELEHAGLGRLKARTAGLAAQEARIRAQENSQVARDLSATHQKISAQRDAAEAERLDAKDLRGKAQDLETELAQAEQQLVEDLHQLLPKTAARIGKAFEGRTKYNPSGGLTTRLHAALEAIENRARGVVGQRIVDPRRNPDDKGNPHTQAAAVLDRYLAASRQAHTRLDALAVKLEKLGVDYTSPRLESFRQEKDDYRDQKQAEDKGQENVVVERGHDFGITELTGKSELEPASPRRHITSDTKLAAVRKLVELRDAVERLLGTVAYADGTFAQGVAEVKRMFGEPVRAATEVRLTPVAQRKKIPQKWVEKKAAEAASAEGSRVEAELKRAGIKTRDQLADWLERQRVEIVSTSMGLIDSTEGRFDQDGVDPVVGNESRDTGELNLDEEEDFVIEDPAAVWDAAIELEGVQKLDTEFAELQTTLDVWAKALGMGDLGIRLVKPSEMRAFIEKAYGLVAAGFMDGMRLGTMGGAYYPGANVIALSPFQARELRAEVLAHEFGHAIFSNELVAKFASTERKDVAQAEAILKDFLAWREKHGRSGAKVDDAMASKKAFASSFIYLGRDSKTLDELSQEKQEYVLDFNEWFADQVSRALTHEGKPQNPVEAFFAALIAKVKKFLAYIAAHGAGESKTGAFLAERSVTEFLQAMFHERQLDAMETRSRQSEAELMGALYERYKEAGERGHTGRQKIFTYLNQNVKDGDQNRQRLANATRAMSEQSVAGHYSREAVSAGASQQHAPFSEQTRLKVKRAITGWLKPEERRVLGRAFSSPHVMRQLRAALRAYPVILDRVERDPLEALSFGYQLWVAGQIDIGPKTQNLFQSFHDYIEGIFGLVSDGKEAQNVLVALAQNLGAGARDPLLNILEGPTRKGRIQRAARFANHAYKDVHHFFGKMFYTASSRMYHTGNPVLRQMADLIQPRVGGEGAKQGMLEARRERIGRFMARRAELFAGVEEDTKTEVLKLLQNPKAASQNAEAVKLRDGVRKLLRDVLQYTKSKGVDIGNLGTDYFPWVFDQKYLTENSAAFRALLLQDKFKPQVARMHFLNLMERPVGKNPSSEQAAELRRLDEVMRRSGAASVRELAKTISVADIEHVLGKPVNYEAVVGGVVETITESGGVADVRLTSSGALHRTPYMTALNPRHLNWIQTVGDERDMAELAKFFTQDLDAVLVNYTHQAVKRAEFVSRFGVQGERIDGMLKQAQALGATADDTKLAEHYMGAVMGTMGTGTNERLTKLFGGEVQPGQVINPTLRLGMSAAMVVQNMAVLGLATFTSLADPVGILVRSGSLREGLVALQAGGREIIAAAKKEKTDLKSLAESLGSIENSAIAEALEWEYGSTYLTPGLKMANELFFRTIGLTQWTRLTRLMALAGGREFLKTHGGGDFNRHSKRYLDQLGLQAGDVTLENGSLRVLTRAEREAASTEERARDDRVRNALNRFVDESILRPNATSRPVWASDPHWMLVWHLKSFTYSFYETVLKRSFNELGEKNLAPVLMLGLFVPAMMGADLLREILTEGEVDDDKDLGDRMAYATQRSGLAGLKQFLLDGQKDVKYGGLGYESFAGPTVSAIQRLPQLFSEDDEKQWGAFRQNLPYQNIWRHWLDEGTGAGR